MNQFTIKVVDKSGNPVACRLYFLQADGSPILHNGQPVYYDAANGTNTMSSENAAMRFKITAPGYVDKEVSLNPGESTEVLEQVAGTQAAAGATGSGNMWMWVVAVVVVAIVVYLYIKNRKKA